MKIEERVEALERRVEELEEVVRPYKARRIREEIRSAQALIEILNLPTGKK